MLACPSESTLTIRVKSEHPSTPPRPGQTVPCNTQQAELSATIASRARAGRTGYAIRADRVSPRSARTQWTRATGRGCCGASARRRQARRRRRRATCPATCGEFHGRCAGLTAASRTRRGGGCGPAGSSGTPPGSVGRIGGRRGREGEGWGESIYAHMQGATKREGDWSSSLSEGGRMMEQN